jgi:hypothetical protein
MRWSLDGILEVASVIGLVVLVIAAISLLDFHTLDYGRCLVSHREHHHTDASWGCLPVMDWDGDLTLSCQDTPAKDWDTTVCDQWEFPNGRAEQE